MRELKRKMLWSLFALFTVLVLLLTGMENYQAYMETKEELQSSLLKISEVSGEIMGLSFGPWKRQLSSSTTSSLDSSQDPTSVEQEDDPDMDRLSLIYDNPVFLIALDHGTPWKVYAASFEDIDIEELIEDADEIGHDFQTGLMSTGNLYVDDLAWYYATPSVLVMVGLQKISHKLLRTLMWSLLTALFFEVILFFVCRKAANWMTAPIEKTMEKQKQFIADASHELKTPVAIILANAEAMEQDPQARWLENIKEEAQRMNGLIVNLLDLTKAEAGKVNLSKLNLSHLLEKQCLIMEAYMFEKNIAFEEDIEPDVFVMGESASLQQVIAILIDNAIAHSTGQVKASLKRKGKEAILTISNTGEAISAEEQEKIFERFYRADSSRNSSAGRYGLGLAIAKSIVESHQGKIKVHCEQGVTSFSIVLKAV